MLEPMTKISWDLEGRRSNGATYDVFPAIDSVLEHLEQVRALYVNRDTRLTQAIELAWAKLDKYHNLADLRLNPGFYAVVTLHPSLKMDYFKYQWDERSEWIRRAEVMVIEMWNTFKRTRPVGSTGRQYGKCESVWKFSSYLETSTRWKSADR